MNQISDYLRGKEDIQTIEEDEYIDESSGLIYCRNCNKPRQVDLKIGDRSFRPRSVCKCQAEKRKQELEEQAQREHLNQIARLKSAGLQDAMLHDYKFENDNGINPEMKKAYDYVEHWKEMKESSLGLVLWGDVGTGKSFFAGCVANALLEKGIPVLMTNFGRILNALTSMHSEDKNKYIDSLNEYKLLIIDDLGMERKTDYALEQIFNVIDARWRSKLPMIVTTNLTLDELKNPPDLSHKRIYERVLERCIPLKINNQNIRDINRAENLKKARLLLSS